jgi:hypothetical protein
MAWECAECNSKESGGKKIDAVCHHCGKPLCREDQVEILDNAFSGAAPTAIHCDSCRRKYHHGSPRLTWASQ